MLDALGDATIFSTLDAHCYCGYWQIEVDDQDRDKMAFTSHHGLYRFVRIPVGLKNALGNFQGANDEILWKVRWKNAVVYLDDVFIFYKTPDDHVEHVRSVLTLLHEEVVTLKLKRCVFFSITIAFICHIYDQVKEVAVHS